MELGAAGLEPAEAEAGGFTVPCNCHYATPPQKMLAKGIEPSTIRLQVGRSTIELHQQKNHPHEDIKISPLPSSVCVVSAILDSDGATVKRGCITCA